MVGNTVGEDVGIFDGIIEGSFVAVGDEVGTVDGIVVGSPVVGKFEGDNDGR